MLSPSLRRIAVLLNDWPAHLDYIIQWPVQPGKTERFDEAGQHRHTVPTVVSCLAGVVRMRSHHGVLDLRPGMALVIAPGVWHRHESLRSNSAAIGVGIMGQWTDIVLQDGPINMWGRLPIDPARGLLARLLLTASEAEHMRTLRDLATQLISERVEPLAFPQPAVERMLTRLWTRLDRGITAADLVTASGLGRSQAFALFTNALGVSPKRAIEDARHELATHLLQAGCATDDVVRACGYVDRRAMARIHRRRGM